MSPRNRLSPIERFKSFASNKIDHNEMPTSQRQSLEQLEPRMMLSAVYTVDTTVDEDNGLGAGAGTSLREAIIAANSTLGLDTILFDTATFGSGTETITLDSLLGELDISEHLSIDASEVSGVTVDGDGNNRVFDIAFGQTVGISSLNIIGGYTTGYGGGIRTGATSAVTLAYVTVDDNTAYLGGGIYSAGALTVINSAISDNHGQYRGGGVFSGDGTSTVITNSTVSGNTAGQGAGVFVKAANLDVTGSTFNGNQAYVGGGVAGFFYSTVTIANSTISGNSSNSGTVGGGGVIAWDNTELLLTNSTVTGNSASSAGGGINKDADSNVTMNNSIVAGNTSDDVNGPGSFYGKNNILSQVSLAGFTNNVDGNQLGVLVSDVIDGTLKHNGGYTLTHNLLADSPALNAGDDTLAAGLLTDQRGVTRFNGTVDIGAVEALNSDSLVVDTLDDELDYDYSDGDLSLREAIFLANTDFGTQTITFDTAVFSGGDDTIMLALGELDITDDVAINASAGNEAIIDADDSSRIFDISANTVSMSHLTLTGGSTSSNGGGIRQTSGALTLSNMTIEDNDAERGGGIYLDGATVTITLSTISGNTSNNDGGGLYSKDGNLNLAYTTISLNTSGDDGGGIQIDGGSLTVNNSLIDQNTANEDGGGLDLDGAATVTVTMSTISGNDTLTEDGGGIKVAEGSSLVLTDSTVTLNSAYDDGGGIQVDTATLSVINSEITGNNADEDGGGIDIDEGSVAVTDSTISGNTATLGGGGVYAYYSTLTLSGTTTLSGNRAGAYGGGIGAYGYKSSIAVTDSTISGNYAGSGGGIAANYGTLTVTGSTISGNTGYGIGGGVYVYNASASISGTTISGNNASGAGGGIAGFISDLTVTESEVSGNTATFSGGGISAINSSSLYLLSSTVSGNYARYGGGIESVGYIFGPGGPGEEEPSVDDGGYFNTVTIVNSTISGNDAYSLGGGIASQYSYFNILSSTITGNTAQTGGGINNYAYSYFTLLNTIVAGNSATAYNDIYGPIDTVASYSNLIGDHTSSGGLTDGDNGNIVGDEGTAALAIGAILDTTLADNGGPTLTHALVSGSKAIDAGDNSKLPNDEQDLNGNTITLETLPYDQRGLTRVVMGTVDIGAIELQNVAPDDLSISNDSIPENSADDTEVGTITVSDPNAADTHTFSLTNDAGGRFDIDANTGVVTVEDGSLLDHETNGSHVITVETTDSGSLTFSKDVTITITDVNEAPTDLSIDNAAIPENSADDTAVGTVTVSDVDAGDTHTFSLTNDAGGRFDIDANTGVVTVEDGSLLDHETNDSHVITVETTDSGSLTFSKDVTITIGDVNEAPDDLAISNNIIPENSADDTEVGTVTVSDVDDGDTHTFSLTDDAGGRFDIDATTGVVTVEDGSLLDHETNGSHVITVQTTDSGTLSITKDVTITIGNVNEAPTDLDLAPSTVPENSADDTVVGTVTVTDEDVFDVFLFDEGEELVGEHTFALLDDAGGRFDIDANTGVVTVEDGSLLDHETNDSHVITVETTDSGSLTFSKDVTITISDVNEAPTDLSISDNTVPENSADDTEVGTVTVSDIDDGDTHTFSLTNDAGGRFDIDPNTGVVTVEDGSLLDHETNGSHVITVETIDSGSLTFSKDVTITISDVNEAPTDLSIDSAAIPENSADDTEVGTVTVSDVDAGDTHTFSLTNDAGGRFDIDANTGVVTVEDGSLLDHETNGSHVITVETADSGSLTISKDVTITISDVNEAPADLAISANIVAENATDDTEVGTVTVSDIDAGDTHTFSLTDDAGGRFDIDANTGVVTVEDGSLLDHETNDSHVITVETTDSGTLSFTKDVTITISDVNEAPDDLSISNNIIPENSADDTEVGTVTVSDIDAGDTHTFSLTNDAGGRFDIDANTGVVTVEDGSLLDHETNGSHVITVEATDSGTLSFTKDVTITISDVNEAPTDLAISNDIIPEDIGDGGEVGSISVTDEDDGDSHTFDLTDDAGGRFAIDPNTGEITVVDGDLIDFDVNASHDITVKVTDSGTLTFSKDITILVTKVFFAPTDITLDNNEVNEGAANGSLVGTVAAVDVPGETNTYQLTDDAGGRFAIDSVTGEITVLDRTLIDFDTNASHDITVRATNSALESFDKTFTINVNDASGLLIPLKMPHGMRVGSKLVGTMKIKITNDSGVDFVKAGDLDVKLIARPTDGAPDVVLDQRSVNANWTSGKTKDWYFNLNYDGLPVGEYQLFGEVCYDNVATLDHVELFASEDRNGNPFLLTVGATHFVDLVGRVETASQNPGSVKAGTTVKTRLLVNIENNGSLPVGPRSIDIAVYAEDTLGNRLPAPVATMTGLHLAYLRPSGRLPVWVHATFPAGVTPANYHFIVEVDSGNDVVESNPGGTGESNNDDNISRRNVNVRRGDIDLVGAISDSKGTPTYASGSAIEDERVFALQNLGNVATPAGATADLVMSIYNSLDVLVRTQTIESHAIGNHIPGTTRFVFALLDQPALAADNYRVEVEIQPENFTDSVLGNNTFEFFFDVV